MTERAPGGAAQEKGARALIGAGSKAYGLLKEALGVYGTAVTVVQLVPAVLALLAVTLSPTAWLSATLRRWVGFGAVAGALVGMLLFARAAGRRGLLARVGTTRSARLAGVAWRGLGVGLVAAALFRLHLSVVDVAFVAATPFLTPVLDFYLGGGPGAAALYNALAAALAGAAVAGFVAGGPAALLRRREDRRARRELLEKGGALAVLDEALTSLAAAKAAVEAAKARVGEMAVELAELRAAQGRGAPPGQAEAAPPGQAAPATSAGAPPDPRAPRAAAGRAPR